MQIASARGSIQPSPLIKEFVTLCVRKEKPSPWHYRRYSLQSVEDSCQNRWVPCEGPAAHGEPEGPQPVEEASEQEKSEKGKEQQRRNVMY